MSTADEFDVLGKISVDFDLSNQDILPQYLNEQRAKAMFPERRELELVAADLEKIPSFRVDDFKTATRTADSDILQAAIHAIDQTGGGYRLEFEPRDYVLEKQVELPVVNTANMHICGNGAKIVAHANLVAEAAAAGENEPFVLKRKFADGTQASAAVNGMFFISNLFIDGANLDVGCLQLSGSYGSVISLVKTFGGRCGFDLPFSIQTLMLNCKAWKPTEYGFVVRSGQELWNDRGQSFLASNAVRLVNCHVGALDGSKAGFYSKNISLAQFINCIVEQGNPEYNFLFDGESNTARSGIMEACWSENYPSKAVVGIAAKQGLYRISDLRTHTPGNLIIDASEGNTSSLQIVVENMSYQPGGGELFATMPSSHVGDIVTWTFKNFPGNLRDSRLWKGGQVPPLNIISPKADMIAPELPVFPNEYNLGVSNIDSRKMVQDEKGVIRMMYAPGGVNMRHAQQGPCSGVVRLEKVEGMTSDNATYILTGDFESTINAGDHNYQSFFHLTGPGEKMITLVSGTLRLWGMGASNHVYTYDPSFLTRGRGSIALVMNGSNDPKLFVNGHEVELVPQLGNFGLYGLDYSYLFYSAYFKDVPPMGSMSSFVMYSEALQAADIKAFHEAGFVSDPAALVKEASCSQFVLNKYDQATGIFWHGLRGDLQVEEYNYTGEPKPVLVGASETPGMVDVLHLHPGRRFGSKPYYCTVTQNSEMVLKGFRPGDTADLFVEIDTNIDLSFLAENGTICYPAGGINRGLDGVFHYSISYLGDRFFIELQNLFI